MRMKLVLMAAAWFMFAPQAMAQSTTQQIADIVFSEVEKRVIRQVLGDGRYVATRDGGYEKSGRGADDRYDDLKRGDDGRNYGKGKGKDRKKRTMKQGGLPPGLAKKEKLPSGLQKQLARNGKLPPGLQKNPLPYEAVVNLPPPPQGTERAVVGGDVVLLEKATGLILDVLTDVLSK